MGSRKRKSAAVNKENKKNLFFAKLNNCSISPRKMRLVADLVRGKAVEKALGILKFNTKSASRYIEKLLMSSISKKLIISSDRSLFNFSSFFTLGSCKATSRKFVFV